MSKSTYNEHRIPYLQSKITSQNYFDIAVGYQSNHANMFWALSFRNPTYENKGYGMTQTIEKSSLALEANKFIVDYSGFAPYIGLNVAFDQIKYTEQDVDSNTKLEFQSVEPGLTIGWDIVPGKTDEALILRTNLRWYPFADFEVDGLKFEFSQLEYNLIQAVFYPGRL